MRMCEPVGVTRVTVGLRLREGAYYSSCGRGNWLLSLRFQPMRGTVEAATQFGCEEER
jgi:hypothetical protein